MREPLVRDPLYCQVNDRLRALLDLPEFSVGERFLTERQIAERFQISRATANKALSTLVAEGRLEFRKGVGTFVAEERLDFDLRSLVGFTEKARAAGKTPATRVLHFALLTGQNVEEPVSALLDLAPDDGLYHLIRLRLADDTPVILEERYLASRYCPDLTETLLAGSLYDLLSEHYHLDLAGAEETIRAVSLTPEEAEPLGVEPGEAALLATAIGFLSGGNPLWFERTLYRGDAYELRNRLSARCPPSPR